MAASWLERKRLLVVILGLFLVAAAVRVRYFEAARLVAEVQYRSALIARSFYFERSDAIPEWRRQVNAAAVERLPAKEPSATQFLVSLLYSLAGRESLRLAQAATTAFWLIGGIFLCLVAGKIASPEAAVFAAAYYLFVPLGVHASISFLPEPLMIMLFVMAIYAIVRYGERPTRTRLLAAALLCGLAILVKPLCLFALLAAFLAVKIGKAGRLKGTLDPDLILFGAIVFLIGGAYYFYGIASGGDLAGQAQRSFIPRLLLERQYWRDLLLTAAAVAGPTLLAISLLGVPLARPGPPRALLAGLWIGYGMFNLAFSRHVTYAGHYHLQLVAIVALSLGAAAGLIVNSLRPHLAEWRWRLPALGALLLLVMFTARTIRQEFAGFAPIEPVELAQEIGATVGHSDQTVYIAAYYGRPLEYLAELSGAYWPRPVNSDWRLAAPAAGARTVEERLAALAFSPDYFVITNLEEYDHHHADLRAYLTSNCAVLAEDESYLIYGKCFS